MPTIAIDAMGGELAPLAVVQGVAAVSLTTKIQCILVGDEWQIQELLEGQKYNPENIAIVHAPEHILTEEEPRAAIRQKRRASVLVATDLVARGKADAVVGAGNMGAALLACVKNFARLRGVHRAAVASVYARHPEHEGQDPLALLLDVGATIRCDPIDLVQFAIMGSVYARRVSKLDAPRVALLNIGREERRGGATLVEAHRALRRIPDVAFVGNIEGHELLGGRADVVVCEGLLGNVVLKLLEGIGEAAGGIVSAPQQKRRWIGMFSSGVVRVKELVDYASYGGAPILGFEHLFIKVHPRSIPQAIANAVKIAAKAVRDGVSGEMRAVLERVR